MNATSMLQTVLKGDINAGVDDSNAEHIDNGVEDSTGINCGKHETEMRAASTVKTTPVVKKGENKVVYQVTNTMTMQQSWCRYRPR